MEGRRHAQGGVLKEACSRRLPRREAEAPRRQRRHDPPRPHARPAQRRRRHTSRHTRGDSEQRPTRAPWRGFVCQEVCTVFCARRSPCAPRSQSFTFGFYCGRLVRGPGRSLAPRGQNNGRGPRLRARTRGVEKFGPFFRAYSYYDRTGSGRETTTTSFRWDVACHTPRLHATRL